MSILNTEVPRTVVGHFQHAAGEIDTVADLQTGGGNVLTIQCEAVGCRVRFDGVDPTAAVGFQIATGASLTIALTDEQAKQVRIIGTAANAIVNVIAFR